MTALRIDQLPMMMLRCLLLTILLENGLAFMLGVRNKKDQLFILLVNIMTNPVAVVSMFVVNMFTSHAVTVAYRYFIEAVVFVTEGFVYKKTLEHKKINPFLLSFILNGSSFFTGEILNMILY